MLTHLADVSIRSLLLASAAALVLWMTASRRTAALQHAIWTAVVCGMLVLFAFGQVLPRLPLRILNRPAAPVAANAPQAIENWLAPEEPAVTAAILSPAPTLKTPGSVDWREILLFAYGIVAFALFLRFATGMFLARRLLATARSIPGGMSESEAISVPVTVGWLRPRIILPLTWQTWDRTKLNAVLAHEGAHVRRRDGLVSALAGVNRCLFWFHPLAWVLERKLAVLAEHACDEASVATLGDREQYAQVLLEMASVVDGSQGRLRYHTLTMAAGSHIGRRIETLLEEGRTFSQGLSWKGWTAVAVIGMTVVTGAGAIEFDHRKPLQQAEKVRTLTSSPSAPSQEPILIAQTAPAPPPAPVRAPKARFEVASIRPAAMPAPGGDGPGRSGGAGGTNCGAQRITMDESLVHYTCVPVIGLIAFAYGIPQRPGLITGPDWMMDTSPGQRFDIEAKLRQGASATQVPEMFQSLLADRFKLVMHRGTEEQPVSAIVVDKGGLKLKEAAPDAAEPTPDPNAPPCSPQRLCSPSIRNSHGEQITVTLVARGIQKYSSPGIGTALVTNSPTGARVEAPSATLAGLAILLQPTSLLNVVDMTGLKGRYQIVLETSLDMNALLSPLVAAAQAAQAAGGPNNPAANSDFAAVNRQSDADMVEAQLKAWQVALLKVGLRLEQRKAPAETLVVDHVEKMPTEN